MDWRFLSKAVLCLAIASGFLMTPGSVLAKGAAAQPQIRKASDSNQLLAQKQRKVKKKKKARKRPNRIRDYNQ